MAAPGIVPVVCRGAQQLVLCASDFSRKNMGTSPPATNGD